MPLSRISLCNFNGVSEICYILQFCLCSFSNGSLIVSSPARIVCFSPTWPVDEDKVALECDLIGLNPGLTVRLHAAPTDPKFRHNILKVVCGSTRLVDRHLL